MSRWQEYLCVGIASAVLGFMGGEYAGKREGFAQAQGQQYLVREFERKGHEYNPASIMDQEKLEVFITGEVPQKPRANNKMVLERIAREGQKPREIIASSQ